MTVCIAAACEKGEKVVVATDGLLSYAGITADVMAAKIYFQHDARNQWMYLFAGYPSNTKMIFEEFFRVSGGQLPTRDDIQDVVLNAYQKRRAHLASFDTLSPYNLTIDEFMKQGKVAFTTEEFNRLSMAISEEGKRFEEQLLVIGWGKAKAAVMLYEVNPLGTNDHALQGIAAIGSGAEVATSTLMLLGQSRDSSLGETMYSVAAAKYATEGSQDRSVGENTAMYVTWKRTESDDPNELVGKFVPSETIEQLRTIWLEYGKPRIPEAAFSQMNAITESIGCKNYISLKRLQEAVGGKLSISQTAVKEP